MRKLAKKILLFVNLVLAALLIISFLSVHISPAVSWIFAFFALGYPFLLIINVLFVIWWMIFRKWYFVISLFAIVLGWHALKSSFQLPSDKSHKSTGEETLTILSYNVRLFNYYQWDDDTSAWEKIVRFIHDRDPDIVCLQEFITLPGTPHDLDHLRQQLKPLSYSHVYYTDHIDGKLNFGMITLSRFPIVHKKMIDFTNSLNGSISSDIVYHGDTIRIINCHLQSIKLRRDYNSLVDSLIFNYSDKQLDRLKDISIRLRQAFIQRAGQVDFVSAEIHASPYPLIVCGDFNDTPVSYTYKMLSEGLKDAFIETGSGVGTTYRENIPYVRIDYVLYSPQFTSLFYNTEKVNWSDHYPVTTRFTIGETADSSDQHSLPK